MPICKTLFFWGGCYTLLAHFVCMPAGAQLWYPRPPKRFGPHSSALFRRGFLSLHPLHIVVGLKLRNQSSPSAVCSGRERFGQSFLRKYLTVDQFVASYAPTAAQVASVVSYLTANGFSNIQASEQSHGYPDGTPVSSAKCV